MLQKLCTKLDPLNVVLYRALHIILKHRNLKICEHSIFFITVPSRVVRDPTFSVENAGPGQPWTPYHQFGQIVTLIFSKNRNDLKNFRVQ